MQHHAGMPRRGRGMVAGFIVALGLSAWTGAACAQDAPAAAPDAAQPAPAAAEAPAAVPLAPAPPPPQQSAQLSEVVVTATKRRSSVRDIPASITSIPGEELAQRNAQGVQDIVKLVPGVNYTEAGDSPSRVTIRGISAEPATSFTTGVLFGDVSFTDQYIPLVALDPNPFDLKSVDVLKGPQGTLFGASALNGAIRYVPNQPRFGLWQLGYYVDYTRYAAGGAKPNYGAVVNVPIGETLGLRVMGFERNTPGYVDNLRTGVKDANRVNQAGSRAILGWEPVDEADIKLTYAWQSTHQADSNAADNTNGDLTTDVRPRASPQRNDYTLLDLNASYDLGFARLVSESAEVHKGDHNYFDASSRLAGGALPLLAQVYDGFSNTNSQEIRLVSPEDKNADWQWVTGVFWSRQRVYDRLDVSAGDPSIPVDVLLPVVDQLLPGLGGLASPQDGQIDVVHTIANVTVRETALFGDVTRRFWKDLELTLGGRLYRTDSSGTNNLGGLVILALDQTPNKIDAAGVSQNGFNPKMSLAWHVDRDRMIYAAASKGFRVGGVQAGAAILPSENVPAVFQSDSIWNYEAGVRTQWFHRMLRFDITGFLERWKSPQYLQPDSTGLLSYISNVGGVKSEGAEAALQVVLPLPGLLLSTSGAYARTVTTKPFTASDGSAVPIGSPWPFAPRWQSATTLAYIREIGPLSVNGALTHTYMGKAGNNLAQEARVFGYQQWDASLSLDQKVWTWLPEVTLTLNNFLDARGVVNRVYSTTLPEVYDDVTYIAPRQITLRLTGHF